MSEPAVYININGELRDASSLTLPQDRAFRGAWQFNGDAVEIDMAKARDIHRDKLRAERKPLLEELDVVVMRAIEDGVSHAGATATKRRLRDVTADPRIDNAATPEELKALTIDVLMA